MIFFQKTEERILTREMLIKRVGEGHVEYFTNFTSGGSIGKPKFVSGVTTVQEKIKKLELSRIADEIFCDCQDSPGNYIIGKIMEKVRGLVEDSRDLAMVQFILQKVFKDYSAISKEARSEEEFYRCQRIRNRLEKGFEDLYRREYCRLVWEGDIRLRAMSLECWYGELLSYSDCNLGLGEDAALEVKFDASLGIKQGEEEKFSDEYKNRRWFGVTGDFRLKMLGYPEIDKIMRLREYFRAIGNLLMVKTVFESDEVENPFDRYGIMGAVYYPDKISDRIGTELVEELQDFGVAFQNNQYCKALCILERLQLLRAESGKIKDQSVRELAEEAIHVLDENMDIIKNYFNIWDAYFGNLLCNVDDWDAYFEMLAPAFVRPGRQ